MQFLLVGRAASGAAGGCRLGTCESGGWTAGGAAWRPAGWLAGWPAGQAAGQPGGPVEQPLLPSHPPLAVVMLVNPLWHSAGWAQKCEVQGPRPRSKIRRAS